LPEVPENIKQAASNLKFRKYHYRLFKCTGRKFIPDNWLYIHSNDLQMGRLTNLGIGFLQLYGNEKSTICALEYWCYDNDEIWNTDEQKLN